MNKLTISVTFPLSDDEFVRAGQISDKRDLIDVMGAWLSERNMAEHIEHVIIKDRKPREKKPKPPAAA